MVKEFHRIKKTSMGVLIRDNELTVGHNQTIPISQILKLKSKSKSYSKTMPYIRRKKKRTSGLNRRLKRIEKKTKSIEKKYHDVLVQVDITNAPVITPISMLAQGDRAIDRDGNDVNFTSIGAYFRVTGNTSIVTGPVNVRLVVFKDKETHGVVPTIAELMEDATPNTLSHFEHVNRKRFEVILDKIMAVGNDIDAYGYSHVWKWYSRLKGTSHFIGNVADQASTGQNAYYVVCFSDVGANYPTFEGRFRLRFYG